MACTGSKIRINGEVHRSVLTLVSVEIEITEVSIDIYPNGTYQSFKCNKDLCQDGMTSYVLMKEVNYCPLYIIRTLKMRSVKVRTDEGEKDGWLANEHKLLLIEGNTEAAPPGCGPITRVTNTNFKSLKIVLREEKMAKWIKAVHALGASELDLDLELRTSAEFLAYSMEQLMKNTVLHVGTNLCKMNQHSLHLAEISPFHPNSLLRVRGEVVSELECTPVPVYIQLGDRRTFCSADSIPGWLGNEPVHVQADTHLIIEDKQVHQIPCTGRYAAIFRADDGVLLQATPVVTEVDVTLSHIDSEYTHILQDEDVHHGDSGDLLYTSEEVEQFNNMIHFSRTKTRVLDALVSKYCESGNCGSYKPSAKSSYFNLEMLKDTITHPFAWVGELRHNLSEIGSYCSLIILLILVFKLLAGFYQLLNLKVRGASYSLFNKQGSFRPKGCKTTAVPKSRKTTK